MAGRAASLGGAVLYSHTDAAVPLRIGRRMQDAPHAWADGESGLPCDKKCIGVLGWSWHCEYRVFGTHACVWARLAASRYRYGHCTAGPRTCVCLFTGRAAPGGLAVRATSLTLAHARTHSPARPHARTLARARRSRMASKRTRHHAECSATGVPHPYGSHTRYRVCACRMAPLSVFGSRWRCRQHCKSRRLWKLPALFGHLLGY